MPTKSLDQVSHIDPPQPLDPISRFVRPIINLHMYNIILFINFYNKLLLNYIDDDFFMKTSIYI